MHSIRVHCCARAEDFGRALLPFAPRLQDIVFRAVHRELVLVSQALGRQDAIVPDMMIHLGVLLFVSRRLDIISWAVLSALIHYLCFLQRLLRIV